MSLLDGLVAHWKLDEESGTRVDSHGTRHLTNVGALFDAGKIGNAAQFTALDQYLHGETMQISETGVTLAFWLKAPSAAVDPVMYHTIYQHDASDNLAVNWNCFLAPSVKARLFGEVTASADCDVVPDEWTLIMIWWAPGELGANLHILANNDPGLTTAEVNHVDTPTAAVGDVEIGPLYSTGIVAFPFLVDSMSVWSRVLTADERSSLWNNGAGLDYEGFAPLLKGGSGIGIGLPASLQTAMRVNRPLGPGWIARQIDRSPKRF